MQLISLNSDLLAASSHTFNMVKLQYYHFPFSVTFPGFSKTKAFLRDFPGQESFIFKCINLTGFSRVCMKLEEGNGSLASRWTCVTDKSNSPVTGLQPQSGK